MQSQYTDLIFDATINDVITMYHVLLFTSFEYREMTHDLPVDCQVLHFHGHNVCSAYSSTCAIYHLSFVREVFVKKLGNLSFVLFSLLLAVLSRAPHNL